VLDRLPTARILKEENGVYTVSAELFGKGIDMWLRSSGIRWKCWKRKMGVHEGGNTNEKN
jgi:hypothetical protein